MCVAVFYRYQGRDIITHFSTANATLVIEDGKNKSTLVAWGRRKQQTGSLPFGGWASTESIEKGKWKIYYPQFVKLPILKFMEIGAPQRKDELIINANHA